MKRIFVFAVLCAQSLFATMPWGGFNRFSNNYFVETGTLGGQGIFNAMQGEFDEFFTVELDKYSYEYALIELQQIDKPFHLIGGNSIKVLPRILRWIDKPATFWLDAHCYPGIDGQQNTPVMNELEAIKTHPIKTHTILIDDMHCLNTIHFDYLTFDELKNKILEINPDYVIELIDGEYVEDDVVKVRPQGILAAYIPKN